MSTSLPAAYRPKMYYQWKVSGFYDLQNTSSGQSLLTIYGDPVPGYSIKDDGRTLVIASAKYDDIFGHYCIGQEEEHWSPYQTYSHGFFSLSLRYRPYIYFQVPISKKFNAIVGDLVSLSFHFNAVPALTYAPNWSFIDTAGHAQHLPANSVFSYSNPAFSLEFTFTSEAYYGNYSITLTNIIGSTTETFQVLRPGPPDPPTNVKEHFASFHRIAITWNCMWFNGREQTIFFQLKVLYNDSVVDSSSTLLDSTCYNTTYMLYGSRTPITEFWNGIQPATEYEVLVWSTNSLGSSDIVKLRVKTPKTVKFVVSPETVSLNGNQAIVNYSAAGLDKIAMLEVICCLELDGYCVENNYYHLNGTADQVTIYNLPAGDVYIFDFTVYGGVAPDYVFYLTMVKGVRVSRIEDSDVGQTTVGLTTVNLTTEPADEKKNPLLIPVIVLGVLLGVAVLAFIVFLIVFIVVKRRQKTQTSNSHQTQQPRTTANTKSRQPTTPKNQAYEEDNTYEAVDNKVPKSDADYTALKEQRYS